MRIGLSARYLSAAEQTLASSVFGSTLPSWTKIMIDDGLGVGDRPYTLDTAINITVLHVGPTCYPDCTSRASWGSFGRIDTVFIHEMTHVWQYGKGYNVKLSSLWGQSFGEGYLPILGKAWDDYNVEQQATIVEHWYAAGMTSSHTAFPYVDKVVRRGSANVKKTLVELTALP